MKWPFEYMPAPSMFDRWNRAMQGAYVKGANAYLAGCSIDDCPYRDKRNDTGRLTWSRAFRICWVDGFVDTRSHDERVQERAAPLA